MEPRSAVIIRHTEAAVRSSVRMCMRKFAARVAEHYLEHYAPDERVVPFHVGTTTETILEAEKANAQLIGRYKDKTSRFPDDLEESWVQALPEPFRMDCARELARRYGFLGAMAPDDSGAASSSIGELAVCFGEAVRALGPILQDGRIDAADCPAQIREALILGTNLQAAWIPLQKQLIEALPALARPAWLRSA